MAAAAIWNFIYRSQLVYYGTYFNTHTSLTAMLQQLCS